MSVNDAAQDFCFFETFLGFVGVGHGPARFQMRGDEGEGEIRRGLNLHFGKSTTDVETASIQKKSFIRVRMPRDDWKFAQHGDVNVRVCAADVFPIRIIESVSFKRRAQFQKRVGRSHFFEREHVGIQRADAFADFGFGFGSFDEVA
jgi:hypothetical protein